MLISYSTAYLHVRTTCAICLRNEINNELRNAPKTVKYNGGAFISIKS